MSKTLPPGVVELPHMPFQTNVMPDVFDERDLEYRPRLEPLPPMLDVRPDERFVLTQEGNSCTGHAVAAMVNTVLAQQGDPVHVSPYMLYSLARRYDEFEGDADEGSSLRGSIKGWYYHGVLPDGDWSRLDLLQQPDIDHDTALIDRALRRPLGAFYRVNAARLDDMQSAVGELFAVVASAAVHDGWVHPVEVQRGDQTMCVIQKSAGARALGGHAFCIAGYNEVGFLVQNSWGVEWGNHGFATLPYDDWLESAYDAWVARPGVPSIVSQRNRSKLVTVTGGLAEGPGPDLALLTQHVVNLGNNGKLSQNGRFVSTPAQLDQIFATMATRHASWGGSPARVVLYAHGGLNSESTGLAIAQRQLNWWLNNKVYPVTFAWQTGPAETLVDQLTDVIQNKLPAGGLGFNLVEQFDRLVEKFARSNVRWMWDEMKENAQRASDEIDEPGAPAGPGQGAPGVVHEENLPGATLTVGRLKKYLEQTAGTRDVEVHLVGHSAGSIFLAGVVGRLRDAEIPVASLTYLAPAIRTDVWMRDVLPHLVAGHVKRFASFGMSPTRELDDVCGAGGHNVYQKSLLYLVSRALERPREGATEVPLVGMAHFATTPVEGTTLAEAVGRVEGDLVWSPSASPATSRSDSHSHGGFDDDGPTMTSVMLRILGLARAGPGQEFVPYAPLVDPEPPEAGGDVPHADAGTPTAGPGAPEGEAGTPAANTQPQVVVADVKEAGETPVTTSALQAGRVAAPPPDLVDEDETPAKPAPTGGETMRALRRHGWERSHDSRLLPDRDPGQ